MIHLTCAFCPTCGIRAWIINNNRTLLNQHIKRNHR